MASQTVGIHQGGEFVTEGGEGWEKKNSNRKKILKNQDLIQNQMNMILSCSTPCVSLCDVCAW